MSVLNFFLELLKTPTIVLALVALIGLIAQGKKFPDVISGTVKTALGYLVLSAGSSLIVTEILPFVGLFGDVTGLAGFATGSEAIVGAIQNSVVAIASSSAIIMGVGFLVNILLARFTPLKYIFLTGHMMWISSVTIAFCMYEAGFNEIMTIVIGSLLQGLFLTLMPAIAQPMVRKLTGSNDFAVAHLTCLGTVSSAYIGGLVGRNSKSAEDMKLPEGLKFFKDTSMSISIVMLVFYMALVIIAGPEGTAAYAGGTNFIIFGLLKALGFTAGVLVLLYGVRLLLGELVPAFKGISDKLVPNAVPALDVPALFGFAPNSLMLGFIFATIGMIVAMFLSSAIFGGGRIGAMVAGFVYGLELILFSAFTYNLFGHFAAVGAEGTGHDCIDAMALMTVMKQPIVGIIIIVAVFVLACVLEVSYQKKAAATH